MQFPSQIRPLLLFAFLLSASAAAGPYAPAGDLMLRHDIQVLVDHGVIKGATTMWPIAWGPIVEDIKAVDVTELPSVAAAALLRVRDRSRRETRTFEWTPNIKIGLADNRPRIRSFQNTPRGSVEVGAAFSHTGDWFSIELAAQAADASGDDTVRFDDAMLGVVAGNWSIAASTQQRWWGPGLGRQSDPLKQRATDAVTRD